VRDHNIQQHRSTTVPDHNIQNNSVHYCK